MILNIHGYNGASKNTMYQILKDLFPEKEVVSPQLDYDAASPLVIRDSLEALVTGETELIAGTSLGGFFAVSLWAKHKTVPTILFNPALTPWTVLPKTGSESGRDDEFKTMLNEARGNPGCTDNLYIILGKRDEVLGNVSDTIMFSMSEFCQTEDFTHGNMAVQGLWRPINMGKVDCGHSAAGNLKAIAQIKETILTLANNGYSNSKAIHDETD